MLEHGYITAWKMRKGLNSMSDKRFCYYIPSDAEQVPGGFVPSAVYADKPGHSPMKGRPGHSPWVWGPDREAAEAAARRMNERMGLTEQDVDLIIASSIGAGQRFTGDEFNKALLQVLTDRSAIEIAGIEGLHEIISEHFKDEIIEQVFENRAGKVNA